MGEFDRDLDCFEEGREDFGFSFFSVLDEDGVMHLKEKLRQTRPPNLKHPSIEYIPNASLRIVSNGFTVGGSFGPPPKKPPLSSHK